MENHIYFRFHENGTVDWYFPENTAGVLAQTGTSLEEIATHCQGKKIVVFIPGSFVHIATLMIPARNRQKIMQAVPYAMEDDLIGEVEDFHFALPSRLPQNNIPVCAIRHEILESVISRFKEHDIHPQMIIPEILAMPFQQKQWTVLMEDNNSVIRNGNSAGFVCDTPQLALYLDMAIKESENEPPETVHIIDARQQTSQDIPGLTATPELQIVKTPLHSSLLELYAKNMNEPDSINLLQGIYAVKNQGNREWKKWLPVATVVGILLLLQAIEGVINYQSVQSELTRTNKRIYQLFRQSLPGVKNMSSIKVRMQRRLNELKNTGRVGQSGFLPLLAKSAKAIQANPGTVIRNISYRNGKMDLEISIGNLQLLEKMKQMIIQSGLSVNVRSASVQGNSVTARLSVQERS